MTTRRQRLGQRGENLAARYLQAKGYRLLARNVRTPYGELDLIAERDGQVVFVEVKTRASRRFGPPEVSVNARKQAHLLQSAAFYAAEHDLRHWRIDVIAIETWHTPPRITHFENAL